MASLLSNTRLGNTGVSSLVKSASTLSNTLNTYNDTVARLTFENSAKTADDLTTYQTYLNSRIGSLESTGTLANATKALDMRQTLTSAIHSSASADIQRSTIAVLDGNGTSDDKLAAIGDAFQKLYAVGDLAAAQSYEQQYYSYSQTVQYQKQQAATALASAASASASATKSAITAAIDQNKQNITNANGAFTGTGPKFLDSQTNTYLKTQATATGAKANGSASIFAAIAGQVGMTNPGINVNNAGQRYAQGSYTQGSILDIYTQAIILDPTNAQKYKNEIDNYVMNGTTGISLPGSENKSITWAALQKTVFAGNSNNAPYAITRGAGNTWNVVKENISGYVFGTDQNNQKVLIPTYSMFTPSIDSKSQLGQMLQKEGINYKTNSDGDWTFQPTTQNGFLGRVFGNYPVVGAVQHDGTIEFAGPSGQLYKMTSDAKGLFGLQQLNQFGQVINNNVAGQYGFTPPKDALTVGKGSTSFMTKVLGDGAAPTIEGNKVTYQANGKTYKLVTDSRGLKGLQEIDASGKVINSNVAGQYGFNPNSLTRGQANLPTDQKGQAFMNVLLQAHEGYMNGMNNISRSDFHNPDNLNVMSASWYGVQQLVDNARIVQSLNQAHEQAMIALAPPKLASPSISLPPPPSAPAPTINVAPVQIQSAPTANSLQTANGNPQSGNNVGAGINQSGGSGIKITGTTNAPVGMRI